MQSPSPMLIIYTTCADNMEAEKIANELVSVRLVACANIFPKITSIYMEKSSLKNTPETVLILKTTKDKFKKIEQKILKLHSYETPCIIATEPQKVNASFFSWLLTQIDNSINP